MQSRIFCTTPKQNFIEVFAEFLLQCGKDLASIAILLPTHRSCLQLKNELIRQSNHLILPTFFALNDIESIFEKFSYFESQSKPKIPAILRLSIFEMLIEKWDPSLSKMQMREFSKSLMVMIDELLREEISIKQLREVFENQPHSSYKKHLQFIELVFESYPKIVEEYGFEEDIFVQKCRIEKLCSLIKTQNKFDAFWVAGFSQYQKDTLKLFHTNLQNVRGFCAIPFVESEETTNPKAASFHSSKMLKELNRPYRFFKENHSEPTIHFTETTTPFYQAKHVAFLTHKLLSEGLSDIAIICPQMAAVPMIQAECEILGIAVNSSLGVDIFESLEGSFMRALIECIRKKDLANYFNVVKHPLFLKTLTLEEKKELVNFEIEVRSKPFGTQELEYFDYPKKEFFETLFQTNFFAMKKLCGAFIDEVSQAGILIFDLFEEFYRLKNHFFGQRKNDLFDLFLHILEEEKSLISPKPFGVQVNLIGIMEARLCRYDALIIMDATDGVIPRKLSPEPWLPKVHREQLCLISNDEYNGLQLQDFLLSIAAAPKVILVHAQTKNGEVQLPSPYLMRIKIDEKNCVEGYIFKQWMQHQSHPFSPELNAKKDIYVPKNKKPTRLSLTAVKTLINDPMTFYARYILHLKPLLSFDENVQAMLIGQAFHDGLDQFVKEGNSFLISEEIVLLNHFLKGLQKYNLPLTPMTELRVEGIARLLCTHTKKLNYISEIKAEKDIGNIIIYAIADLLTQVNNTIILADYKTGSIPTQKEISLGKAPQLALEGVIFSEKNVSELQFIKLAAKPPYVDIIKLKDAQNLISEAEEGVQNIAYIYLQDDFVFSPNFNMNINDPYRHFARIVQ